MGWFGRYQDTSDFEWNCWTKLTLQLVPWLILNCAGGLVLRAAHSTQLLPLWYSLVSLVATAYILSPPAAGLFLVISLLFHLSLYLRQPLCIWLLGFLWRRYVPSELLAKSDEEVYLIEVRIMWNVHCIVSTVGSPAVEEQGALYLCQCNVEKIILFSLYLPGHPVSPNVNANCSSSFCTYISFPDATKLC